MLPQLFGALALALSLLLACSSPPPGRGAGEVATTADGAASFRVETVVSNLEVPWAIVFTPDGRMLFTERPGRVRVFENGKLRPEPLATIPDVEPTGESGLMGLTLHPQFAQNHLLYLAYAYRNTSGEQRVRVVRFRETGNALTDRKLIIEEIPAAQFHAGTRLRFGPDGKLYITTGDATERELAQQLGSLAGKNLRLNEDGAVPNNKSFLGQPNFAPGDWGHANIKRPGIRFLHATNLLWETEHGPSGFDGPGGGDEVNIIERGKNYGWPVIH